MLRDFPTRAVNIVTRTALLGLTESELYDTNFEKWLLVWTCDVAGELAELIEASPEDKLVECGDVLWGITALAQLLNISMYEIMWDSLFESKEAVPRPLNEALMASLNLLDHCKKVTRDGRAVRPVDLLLVASYLSEIFTVVSQHFCMEQALDAVNKKLLKRYPDGYTPEASVNRSV